MPATPSGVRGAVIAGWGTSLPEKVLTNAACSGSVDARNAHGSIARGDEKGARRRPRHARPHHRPDGPKHGAPFDHGRFRNKVAGTRRRNCRRQRPRRPAPASIRIVTAPLGRLGILIERAAIVLDRTSNTSVASIPLALAEALDTGRVSDDDLILFVGFGAGMSAASAVLRWTA